MEHHEIRPGRSSTTKSALADATPRNPSWTLEQHEIRPGQWSNTKSVLADGATQNPSWSMKQHKIRPGRQFTSRASRTNHDFAQMEPGRISCASLPIMDSVLHRSSWIAWSRFFCFLPDNDSNVHTHTLGIPVSPCLPIR